MEARSLTDREQEILEFLLTPSFPGVEALREQAQTAAVVGSCDCGCATIELAVDNGCPPSEGEARQTIVAEARTPEDREGPALELILFVNGDRLSSIAIVYYDDNIPHEFPPPAEFGSPYARMG